jgi:hypothetical protein
MRAARLALLCAAALLAGGAGAYPIDAYPQTGIPRLEAYRLVQEGEMQGRILPWGGQLYLKEVKLRLLDQHDFVLPEPDPELTERVVTMLGEDADGYGLAILDISIDGEPRLVLHNPDKVQNPGSVGKILVLLGWFQALADVYPEDKDARHRVLRDTRVVADDWIKFDSHDVPFWTPGEPAYEKRPIAIGDAANLYTWLDWMASASSNAAAGKLQSELLLLKHFGVRYPVPRKEADAFLKNTPKSQLAKLYREAMIEPIARNGLDPEKLRQGSFFTRTGKGRVPGTNSVSTAGELMRFLLFMEQGKLVDVWSSMEIKRLLYLTDGRIRYASSRALYDFAVYFKSGSLYGCKPEKGFECGKYLGNRMNYMNSIAVVEGVETHKKLDYIAVMLSNVLRKNSADLHRDVGAEVQRILIDRLEAWEIAHPPPPEEVLPWLNIPARPIPDASPDEFPEPTGS